MNHINCIALGFWNYMDAVYMCIWLTVCMLGLWSFPLWRARGERVTPALTRAMCSNTSCSISPHLHLWPQWSDFTLTSNNSLSRFFFRGKKGHHDPLNKFNHLDCALWKQTWGTFSRACFSRGYYALNLTPQGFQRHSKKAGQIQLMHR